MDDDGARICDGKIIVFSHRGRYRTTTGFAGLREFVGWRNIARSDDNVMEVRKDGLEWLVDAGSHQTFWERLQAGKWEPELFRWLKDLLGSETVFLDVGGWIGPTTLFGAQLARKTYSFEPSPEVFAELKNNVALNTQLWARKIVLINAGAYFKDEKASFAVAKSGDDSTGSLLNIGNGEKIYVDLIDFRKFIIDEGLAEQNVVMKMDIEGAEFDIVPHLKEHISRSSFTTLLSLHPKFLYKKLNIIYPGKGLASRIRRRLEMALAYRRIYHSFSGRTINDIHGVKLGMRRWFLFLLLLGSFPHDILVYNSSSVQK